MLKLKSDDRPVIPMHTLEYGQVGVIVEGVHKGDIVVPYPVKRFRDVNDPDPAHCWDHDCTLAIRILQSGEILVVK